MSYKTPKNDEAEQQVTVTDEMIDAGVSVLWNLAGEASKEAQAKAVFLAMISLSPCCHPQSGNSESKDVG